MTEEEVVKLCRPLPTKGTLRIQQTDHGFVRVAIETKEPEWYFTAFAVWPDESRARVQWLYRETCKQHARGYKKCKP